MPGWGITLIVIVVVFVVLYAAYRGIDKLIDWVMWKIFDED